MKAEVIDDLERLEKATPGWDALAAACSRPRAAPAWTMAWYRHALPAGAQVRAVVVRDGEDVAGVVPMAVTRTGFGLHRYAMAAPMLAGVEPLSRPGCHDEVGRAIGAALAGARPTPDLVVLGWMPAGSPLPPAIQAGWDGPRPEVIDEHTFPSPLVRVAGYDFETWLGERSSKFRYEFRSDSRKLEAAGFAHHMAEDGPDIVARLGDMQRLYERRRAARGGAGPHFDRAFMDVVTDAVTRSRPGQVRLSTIEKPGQVIAADFIMTAGAESSFWISGFDDEHSSMSPGQVNVLLCIKDAMERGEAVFDLGPGTESYKVRITKDEALLQGFLLVRRGLRPLGSPARLVPYGARQRAAQALGRLRGSR